MSDRLREKAEACLGMIERLSMSIRNHEINDYGDATGFCDEEDNIREDLYDYLGRTTARAARVLRRINKTQQQYAEEAQEYKDPVKAFNELRERFGGAFDEIKDVEKFLRDLRE